MNGAFTVLAPGRIVFGRGKVAEVPGVAAGFGRRVLVVHGASPSRSAPVVRGLRGQGCDLLTIACGREPNLPMLEDAVTRARAFGAEVVVAVGGGAVIDLAKAVAALVPGSSPAMDHLEVVGRGLPLAADPLPIVAVPTTAGTGAEVTKNAVIDVPEHRRKVSLRDDRMVARVAVIDPALTDGTPRGVTLASGLDAVVQVIEPYLCTRANPYTDALARAAIPVGLAAMKRLMAGEDREARDRMAWVSLSGGLCLANSGLGAVHGFAGVIGGLTRAAHGAVCGALLVPVLRMNARALGASGRMAEVMGWIAAEHGSFDGFAEWMRDAGLPGLAALGVDPADHDRIAEAALQASSMKANPVEPPLTDLVACLEEAA